MSENKSFHYTYSAVDRGEILRIQKKYGITQTQEDSVQSSVLEELRRLDKSTTTPGTIASLTVGLVGTLTMGLGMSMAMVWNDRLFVWGIIVGVLGMALAACAYPLYKRITEKQKQKNLPRIRELSEKLLEER